MRKLSSPLRDQVSLYCTVLYDFSVESLATEHYCIISKALDANVLLHSDFTYIQLVKSAEH